MNTNVKVYIDTNVLFNYCVDQQKEIAIINYLTKVRRKENLFVSSLSVIQIVSILQSRNKKNFSNEQKHNAINNLRSVLKKFSVARLEEKDIAATLGFDDLEYDLEGVAHYCIYKKTNCDLLITNNVSDFSKFKPDVNVLSAHLGMIKNEID